MPLLPRLGAPAAAKTNTRRPPWKLVLVTLSGEEVPGPQGSSTALTPVGTCKTIKNRLRELGKHIPWICPGTRGTHPAAPEGARLARGLWGPRGRGEPDLCHHLPPAWDRLAPPRRLCSRCGLKCPGEQLPGRRNELDAQGQGQSGPQMAEDNAFYSVRGTGTESSATPRTRVSHGTSTECAQVPRLRYKGRRRPSCRRRRRAGSRGTSTLDDSLCSFHPCRPVGRRGSRESSRHVGPFRDRLYHARRLTRGEHWDMPEHQGGIWVLTTRVTSSTACLSSSVQWEEPCWRPQAVETPIEETRVQGF